MKELIINIMQSLDVDGEDEQTEMTEEERKAAEAEQKLAEEQLNEFAKKCDVPTGE